MIVTLTSNPSLDRTLELSAFRRGEVNRSPHSTLEPGGKGVNVSRVLLAHGTETTAVLPCGGVSGRLMSILLSEELVPFAPVPIAGSLRVNTAVVEPDGTTTQLNEIGPTLAPDEAFALLASADDLMEGASWLAVCGSLAPGLPADFCATAVRRAHTYGVQVAVDVAGEALQPAIEAGADLITPNRAELAAVVGTSLTTLGDVRRAGENLVRSGIPAVIVTLGRDGALLVTDRMSLHARAREVQPVSRVGAGEALLAGVLHSLEHGSDMAQALTTGVQWGTAAVQLPGSRAPGPDDVAAVSVIVTPCEGDSLVLAD